RRDAEYRHGPLRLARGNRDAALCSAAGCAQGRPAPLPHYTHFNGGGPRQRHGRAWTRRMVPATHRPAVAGRVAAPAGRPSTAGRGTAAPTGLACADGRGGRRIAAMAQHARPHPGTARTDDAGDRGRRPGTIARTTPRAGNRPTVLAGLHATSPSLQLT